MFRRVTRTLCLIDDVLEVIVWYVGRLMARHPDRTAILVMAVAGCLAVGLHSPPPAPPPPPPSPVAPVVSRVVLPPDIEPTFEAEIDRGLVGDGDFVDFTVVGTRFLRPHAPMEASIEFRGARYDVVPGSVVPRTSVPEMVVTEVEQGKVTAIDLGSREYVIRYMPAIHGTSPVNFKVCAIAGESPHYVAVIDFEGQTYIVQPGTRVPDDRPAFEVKSVTTEKVEVFDLRTQRIVSKSLAVEDDDETPRPPRKAEESDIDLDGI